AQKKPTKKSKAVKKQPAKAKAAKQTAKKATKAVSKSKATPPAVQPGAPQAPQNKSACGIHLPELSGASWLVTALAIGTGMVMVGLIVALTTEDMYRLWSVSPIEGLRAGWQAAWSAYSALFNGAIGNPTRIIEAFQGGDPAAIRSAINPFFESLNKSVPYI